MNAELDNDEFNFRHNGTLSRKARMQKEYKQIIKLAAEYANYDQAEAWKSYQRMRTW